MGKKWDEIRYGESRGSNGQILKAKLSQVMAIELVRKCVGCDHPIKETDKYAWYRRLDDGGLSIYCITCANQIDKKENSGD